MPPGFDPDRIRVQSIALAAKRRDGVARALPDLVEALGERWPREYLDWARTNPKPETGGSRADGLAFAAYLAGCGRLPEPAAPAAPPRPGAGPAGGLRARLSGLWRGRTRDDGPAWRPDDGY